MKMVQMQKLSLLGLVLMAVASITAFVMPKSNKKVFSNGHIQQDSTAAGCPPQPTCRTGIIIGAPKCDFTATDEIFSFTTLVGDTSADGVTTHAPGCDNTGLFDDGNGTLVTNL